MTRTGQEYIDSLRDGRQVYLDGELITDVVDHPAYRNAVRSTAALYDFQAAPENLELMTFESPTSGERVNRCWQLPQSYDELVARRKALEAWAECTYGYMGRSPDHVASSLAGMMMRLDLFRSHGEERAQALANYYQYVRDNDVFVTYTITNPQGWTGEHDEFLVAGIYEEDSTGVTIKGAKTLGTSSILADEVLCTTIQPLQPGAEKHAFSVAIPMSAPGLKILSRKSYEAWAQSEFDNPLSYSLDENDAILYFDEVKVPWERVFIHRDIKLCRDQFHEAPTHIFQNYQSQVRVMVKLRFLVGLARKMADANDLTRVPQVVETLGRLAAQAGVIEGMVNGMEAAGRYVGPYYVPDRHPLYAAQVTAQELYPQIMNTLRDLAGGSPIMLPSSANDFGNPEIADYIARSQSAIGPETEERVKLFKLAWDAIGSEFASRHIQFELFYAGAGYVVRNNSFRTYDWDRATGMVDSLLGTYGLPG
jgi:4-hydroxyphenylacetate 3-monooxygenase